MAGKGMAHGAADRSRTNIWLQCLFLLAERVRAHITARFALVGMMALIIPELVYNVCRCALQICIVSPVRVPCFAKI